MRMKLIVDHDKKLSYFILRDRRMAKAFNYNIEKTRVSFAQQGIVSEFKWWKTMRQQAWSCEYDQVKHLAEGHYVVELDGTLRWIHEIHRGGNRGV